MVSSSQVNEMNFLRRLLMALRGRQPATPALEQALDKLRGQSSLVDGFPVDLEDAVARRVLKAAPWRIGTMAWYGESVEVYIDGKWRTLARTDLKDDVRTGRRAHSEAEGAALIKLMTE